MLDNYNLKVLMFYYCEPKERYKKQKQRKNQRKKSKCFNMQDLANRTYEPKTSPSLETLIHNIYVNT